MMRARPFGNCEDAKGIVRLCDFYNRSEVPKQHRSEVPGQPRRQPMAALTLGEILAAPGLGLELLAGFEAADGAPVAGAHCIEVERPSRWLAEDWIMLTTGLRLRGRATAQRELVDELIDAGCCALGFGLGVAFAAVPAALLDQAQQRGFPLFAVPLPTPFRVLVSAVQRALISAEIRGEVRTRAATRSTKGDTPSERLLAPLHARPQLHETLLAYLDSELDVSASAATLGLHANTMRYRLRHIERLLGGSLKSPELLSRVYLAVRGQGERSD